MTKLFGFILALALHSTPTWASIKVVTTTTDLAWLVKEIGGTEVEVTPLLSGRENPHYIDTVPDFIRRVADADVVCIVGMDLEIGWIPKVLSRSGNAQVQPSGKGYCEVGKTVDALDKPSGPIDRSMGDVHPMGNPHFWLSPQHLSQASNEVKATLTRVFPSKSEYFSQRTKEFTARMKTLEKEAKAILQPLTSSNPTPKVIEYHKEFTYLLNAFGISSVGSVEEKPGVLPSAGRLAEVSEMSKQSGVRVLLAAPYAPKSTVRRFEELSSIKALIIPTSAPRENGTVDFPKYYREMIRSLAERLAGDSGRG